MYHLYLNTVLKYLNYIDRFITKRARVEWYGTILLTYK